MKKGICQEIVRMEVVVVAVALDLVLRLLMTIGERLLPAAAAHGLRVLMQLQGVEQHPVLENQMTMIGEFKHLIEEAVGQHQVPVNQLTMTGELLPHL